LSFKSWLALVRRKWTRGAADSAVAAAQRGGNGGLLILRRFACEQRVRVAGKAANQSATLGSTATKTPPERGVSG